MTTKKSATKSLDLARNDAARAFVRRIIDRDFDGNVLAASRAMGIAQSSLHEFLSGGRGAGMHTLDKIALYAKVPVSVVVGREAAPDDPYPNRAAVRGSPEYLGASQRVREAFDSLRGHEGGDESVVQWSKKLLRLIEWDELGMLETRGGDATRLKPGDD